MAVESKKAKCSKFKSTASCSLPFPEMWTKPALYTQQEEESLERWRKETGTCQFNMEDALLRVNWKITIGKGQRYE